MWAENLLEASFGGVKFDCLSIDDSFDKATVEHAFPYLAGAEVEDMGRGPRKVSIQAIFYDDGKKDDYKDRLKAFVAELEKPGARELVHPVFGSMKDAQVVRGSIHHEADNVDQATLSFELTESTAGNPFFAKQSAQQKAEAVNQKAQAARDASAWTMNNAVSKLKALNPMSQLTALRQQLLAPVFALKALAGGILAAGMDVINYPLSWAGDLTSLAGGVMNFGGFSVSTLLSDYRTGVSRLAGVLSTGSTVTDAQFSGATVTSQLANGATVVSEPLGAGSTVTRVQSVGPVTTVTGTLPSGTNATALLASGAVVPRIDITNPTETSVTQASQVHIQVERAATVADAAAVVLQSEAETATLSPAEIETVCNSARSEIEVAIELARATYPIETARPIIESLKDTALSLQEAAQAIIVARPPLITRQVLTPAPLRVLAHRWYADHDRALELQRLNGLANPNFLQATDRLNAYAV
jgi:prophage DNA circulation protein